MVGCLAVLLRFCRPFTSKADKQQSALQHLSPSSYYTRHRHRLASTGSSGGGERTLVGAAPQGEEAGGALRPFPYLTPDGVEGPHFVADCFFLTQVGARGGKQ